MKARIARKIVNSWPARCWRYRQSTLQRAFRICSFKAIDSPAPLILVPKSVMIRIDENGPFEYRNVRMYLDATN